MSISREYNVSLANLSTFRMGGTAREVVTVETEEDLQALFATLKEGTKWIVIGGGSNVLFPDGEADVLVVRLGFKKMHLEEVDADTTFLVLGASVPWDEAVAYSVRSGLSGIEALSLIPGSSGATPVQNVGAYGREIADVLATLRAFDTKTGQYVSFSNRECEFGYRDSIFKHVGKGRYIITEITLALTRELPNVPMYPGVAEYLAANEIKQASLLDIRNAIISIRTKKLPDPKDVASVGSFFKNSFVPKAEAEALKAQYPTLAVFPVDDKISKVGTGSLIDTLGYKGKRFGNFSLYSGNAMVVVHEGGGTRKELEEFVGMLVLEVKQKYGITIEPEPEMLNFE
jgi:UDP-N-acetylmuramate dehydrogenase